MGLSKKSGTFSCSSSHSELIVVFSFSQVILFSLCLIIPANISMVYIVLNAHIVIAIIEDI